MRRKPAVGCAIVVLATILTCAGLLYFADSGEKEKARLQRAIAADLPLGSSKPDVEAWLAARGLQADEHTSNDNQNADLVVLIHRDYWLDWSCDLQITFAFDQDARLTKYRVSWRPITF
jgi:hypothetical protein